VYELSLYVQLNPVRTLAFGLDKKRRRTQAMGLTQPPTPEEVTVRLKCLREYPWSSYRAYGGYTGGSEWLTTEEILRRGSRKAGESRAKYRKHVKERLTHGIDESGLERFRDAVGIGSAHFVDRIKKLSGEGERETERRDRLRERVSYEEVVKAVESVRGRKRKEWLHKHGDWGKWIVLRLARQYCGLTLSELGQQTGGSDYAAVSMGRRRFEKRVKADRKLRSTYDQAKRMLNI